MSVPKILLHPEGPSVSRLIYGCWRLLNNEDPNGKTPEAILQRIKKCISLGITTFDHADIYGGGHHGCEKLFGQALRLEPSLRQQIQIVTKTGIRAGATPGHYNLSYDYILKRVDASLEALGVDYVDVLLIHRPSPLMNADEVSRAFQTLKSQNKVHYFGVSNFTPSQFDLLQSRLSFPLVTNQLELHPLTLEPFMDGTLDHLQRLRVAPMAWSPLAGGRLVKATDDDRTIRVQETVWRIAGEVGKHIGSEVTADQVIFAWLLQHPSNIAVVLGTNNLERIEAATKSLDIKLTLEQWFFIYEASAGRPVP
ncbi:hypothetical protein HK097_011618 [Rhizophlyctis rosea]|uniref:NADP-dependent oxidoreductase domain-containing protein n=1 Tax=Rhizophlyctis rosea TaxID=64517 RepID=A0AAD5X3R7_9FUNG|nr:hypothetical protein HK097_011618 [Rhizophlyctis rosea]